jgi:hypothetical protein
MISSGGLVTMTPKQLIDKAAQSGCWEFDHDKRIRRWYNLRWECPIVAVANELLPPGKDYFNTSQWREAADFLGLSCEDASDIVYAADTAYISDQKHMKHIKGLRELMLTEFGLR